MREGQTLVEARGLRKRFGNLVAVDGIDLEVRRGEAFGILGPNGAGKSTAMRMIGCTSPPSDGELTVFGLDPVADGPAIRRRLGVVPQADALDLELTVFENLMVYGRYFGLARSELRERAAELLEFAHLDDRRDSKVDQLSGGMRRRLTIARALVSRPELMLLDEPTTGLDPQARHLLWDRLFRLRQEGVTLLVTTHYMEEAHQLCDRLVVLDAGRVVDEGSPAELIAHHVTRDVVEIRTAGRPLPEGALVGLGRVEDISDRTLLYVHDGDEAAAEVHRRGVDVDSVLVRRATLEDVFLRLTGRTLGEGA